MEYHITLPLTREKTSGLKAGDSVYLTGVIYTARDAAHKRIVDMLPGGGLPFELEGSVIYYVGPTPAKPGQAIGSAGPTTSYRMDAYAPALIERGLMGMIGKGMRSNEVIQCMKAAGAVYFGAIGGAGALLACCVKRADVIAFDNLGPEAVHRLEVENFPVVVIIDSEGGNLYAQGREQYLKSAGERE